MLAGCFLAMAGDAKRIFTGIAGSYDRVATVLSLGQDPRWRRALVDAIDARQTDRVLDVATGTGMVAQALRDRYGCVIVGLDLPNELSPVVQTVVLQRIAVGVARARGLDPDRPKNITKVTKTW